MSKSCSVSNCQQAYYGVGFCRKHYQRHRKYSDPLAGCGNHAPPTERFWRHVEKATGCWNWKGCPSNSGYGIFSVSRTPEKVVQAHRYSYALHKGKIPRGMVVMHSCDNRLCVNPEHLSVGTRKDNTQDMIAKGRHVWVAPLGTDNGKAKITPAKVQIIRQSAETNKALAERWGLGINTIRGVRTGRTWSHIK